MSVNDQFNYASTENKAAVLSCSSQSKGCSVNSILSSDRKSIWLSEKEVPQTIVLDLTQLVKRPKTQFKAWGVYCWHAYSTNPKVIELQSSEDNKAYTSLGVFQLNIKAGTQIFALNSISKVAKVNYLKLIIKETFGGNRTYFNQLLLLEDMNSPLAGPRMQTEGESFFNSDQFKDEEDNYYEPISPMKEVKKYSVKLIESSNREATEEEDEEEVARDEDKLNGDKMKKIEKILKTKARNYSKPQVDNEEEDNGFNERMDKSKASMTPFPNIKPINKTISYNQLNDHALTQKTISSNTKRDNSTANNKPHMLTNTITYGNLNQRRALTPLKQSQINYTTATRPNRDEDSNDAEYKRLENQLKDMEEHLKSMNADSTLAYEKSLIHSKSSGYLQKDAYGVSMQGMLSNNPFIQPSPTRNNPTPPSNRLNELDAYLIDDKAAINLPFQSDSRALNYISGNANITMPPSLHTNRFQQGVSNNINLYYDKANEMELYADGNKLNDNEGNSKMNQIEAKINNLEGEIHEMKVNFDKLSANIQLLIKDSISSKSNMPLQQQQPKQHSNAGINDQMVSVILTECAKMINAKFSEYQSHNSSFNDAHLSNNSISPKTNSFIRGEHHLAESAMSSFESRLNKKIEEKFDSLSNNIQAQIYDNFLKPSIVTIENTMRTNLEEIKQKVNSLNERDNDTGSFIDSYHCSKSLQSSILSVGKSTQRRNEKIEEINAVGERLYDKLVEKEKKLNDLKKETANYLKKKIKNEEKKNANTS